MRIPFTRSKITSEISNLRENINNVFYRLKWSSRNYQLDSSKVDYKLTKALYHNTEEKYKLGAFVVKPIINSISGFMGLPTFKHVDPKAQERLEQYTQAWSNELTESIRNALRDGDVYVRLLKVDELHPLNKGTENKILYHIIPSANIRPIWSAEDNRIESYIIRTDIVYENEDEQQLSYTVVEKISDTQVDISYTGNDIPKNKKDHSYPNPYGFIPIVIFKNESEADELYGRSELEPLEPYIKAYSDVMLYSLQGSKIFSNPKIALKVRDSTSFFTNNFTEEENKAGTFDFRKLDVIVLGEGDEAKYLEVNSSFSNATDLLEYLFYCMIDVSQTPEFIFGAAVSSSKASVSEQMVPFVKKIERKQQMFTKPMQDLSRILLAMLENIEMELYPTFDTDIIWDVPDYREGTDVATELTNTITAVEKALTLKLITRQTAQDYLASISPLLKEDILPPEDEPIPVVEEEEEETNTDEEEDDNLDDK